jgi:hypothetical protein
MPPMHELLRFMLSTGYTMAVGMASLCHLTIPGPLAVSSVKLWLSSIFTWVQVVPYGFRPGRSAFSCQLFS